MRNATQTSPPHAIVLILSREEDAELLSGLHAALNGDQAGDRRLAVEALRRLLDPTPVKPKPADRDTRDQALSIREREVVELLASGQSNRDIAKVLCITTHTVKAHVEHILTKLGVRGRTQAAVRAIELGYATGVVDGPRSTVGSWGT